MDYTEYVSFFRSLAERHKLLLHSESEKHFIRANIEEIITGLRSDVKFPCMILEAFEMRFSDKRSDNIYFIPVCAFNIIQQVERDDFKAEEDALNTCMEIANDILTAVRHDYRTMNNNPGRLIKYFDIETVNGYKIGPVFETCFGWRMEFQVGAPKSFAYDANKWTS